MSTKYNSLEELRRKKALLKKEVSDLEDLLTFDNAKESLSALTHGFTDKYYSSIGFPKPFYFILNFTLSITFVGRMA